MYPRQGRPPPFDDVFSLNFSHSTIFSDRILGLTSLSLCNFAAYIFNPLLQLHRVQLLRCQPHVT